MDEERVSLLLWTVDHLEDVESDMSVFHRVNDIYTMQGPRFFDYVLRLGAYMGVVQARIAKEKEDDKGPDYTPGTTSQPSTVDESTALAMLGADWVEHTTEEEE